MTVASFVPKFWNAAILEPFEKDLVYGQPSIASTQYTGQIANVGDTVTINSIGSPTVRKYVKGVPLESEQLNTTPTTITVDQGDYFNFSVNDVDKVQAAGDFQGPATRSAARALSEAVDKYLAGVLRDGVLAANKIGQLAIVDDDPDNAGEGQITAYKALVKLSEKLNNNSVPTAGRYVVAGPKFHAALLMDPRFTKVDASGTDQGLRNAIVGRAVGFDVLVSNNVPVTAGREIVIAGVPEAFTFVNQLAKTEAIRDQSDFADLVRGLNIYGSGVVRPEGLASLEANVAAPIEPSPAG